MCYLAEKGIKLAPFKVGPDFIDPGHHTRITGKTSVNLDSWMLERQYNEALFQKSASGSDLAVVEGVMGLFDGYDGLSEAGSTAQMAKWLNLPVVLLVSAKGKARSAAAIVKGFETFDKDLTLAGVIFSQTGSARHYDYLKKAVEQNCQTRCLGHMPRDEAIAMPERHLGLVTAEEQAIPPDVRSKLCAMVRDHIDMDALIQGLSDIDFPKTPDKPYPVVLHGPDQQKPVIAVAKDKAFCFCYPDNLSLLEKYGARIVEFSPLNDEGLPDNIHGIYLCGGYPELYAGELSQKQTLLSQIRAFSHQGMPIYGECGGFMVLCRTITGMDGKKAFPMAGCFDLDVQMSSSLRSLGYREITFESDTIIGKKGMTLRGHEFHYSSLKNPEAGLPGVFKVTSRDGQVLSLNGYQRHSTLGSYFHAHFGSNEDCAKAFAHACQRFKDHTHGCGQA